MTNNQDAIVDMYQEVVNFFAQHPELIEKDTILKNHTEQLDVCVSEIDKYHQAQEFDSKGYATEKQKAKSTLSTQIFGLTSGFCSFAIDTNNQPIEEQFDVSESYVNKKSDANFVNYANQLATSLGDYIKELAPYHITADELVNLTKKTQEYTDILHVPDEVLKNKGVATDKIKELITDGHNLLDNSIDRDMVYYKDKQEDLYSEYIKRREIHDADTTHKSIVGIVSDAHEPAHVLQHAKGTVKFRAGKAWKEMHCTSTGKGNYQFVGIPDGLCTLTFTREQYDTVIKEVTVYSNKATKLDIQMKKSV